MPKGKVVADDTLDDGTNIKVVERAGLNYVTLTPDIETLLGFDVQFVYERNGSLVRFKAKGLNTIETRAIMTGLWMRLDQAHKEDYIKELQHYLEPNSQPSEFMRVIEALGKDDNDNDTA